MLVLACQTFVAGLIIFRGHVYEACTVSQDLQRSQDLVSKLELNVLEKSLWKVLDEMTLIPDSLSY